MKPPRIFLFDERLAFSEGHAPSIKAVEEVIKSRIPGCVEIDKADTQNDRDGTDYFIYRQSNDALRLDLKLREEDWSVKPHPFTADDLALEIWSVIPNGARGKVGWTRDETKNSDFILWYWQDTGRFFLVSFPALCSIFSRFWQTWESRYKTATQNSHKENRAWQSKCVFVPREVVIRTLLQWQSSSLEYIK